VETGPNLFFSLCAKAKQCQELRRFLIRRLDAHFLTHSRVGKFAKRPRENLRVRKQFLRGDVSALSKALTLKNARQEVLGHRTPRAAWIMSWPIRFTGNAQIGCRGRGDS